MFIRRNGASLLVAHDVGGNSILLLLYKYLSLLFSQVRSIDAISIELLSFGEMVPIFRDANQGRPSKSPGRSSIVPVRSRGSSPTRSPVSSGDKDLPGFPGGFQERWRGLWDRPLLNTWLAESCALFFSASCLVAIAIVLKVHDSKVIPQVPLGLTLNSVVSILATGSKSSLLLAVAGTIGQLKWCWFSDKPRELEDLQGFDDASRGPWGSLSLLCSLKVKSLASIGALITVLTLGYDPFVQQVLKYPVRQLHTPSRETTTARTKVFVVDANTPHFGNALNAGIWSDEASFQWDPPCPSGDCNWAPYRSVGWCSECEDITSRITVDDCPVEEWFDLSTANDTKLPPLNCNLTLDQDSSVPFVLSGPPDIQPSLSSLHFATEISWLIHSSTGADGPVIAGIEDPLLIFGQASVIYASADYPGEEPIIPTVKRAEQCALTPCARTYNMSVVNGKTRADIMDINYGSLNFYSIPAFKNLVSPFQRLEIFCWQADPGNLTWSWVMPPYEPWNQWLPNVADRYQNKTDDGFCDVRDYQTKISEALIGNATISGRLVFPGDGDPDFWAWLHKYPYTKGGVAPDYTNVALQRITAANLSTVVGSIAASLTKLGLEDSNFTTYGNISTTQVYVKVEWNWLIFPMALEILGIALLVLTMIMSRFHKTRLWKSSVLPLLYHGLDDSIARTEPMPADVFGMSEMARRSQLRLGGPQIDGRIVLGP